MPETKPGHITLDQIIRQPFRFSTLMGDILVAYPAESRQLAVLVRMVDHDQRWSCYCSDVVFESFSADRQTCQFSCNQNRYEQPCRIIQAQIQINQLIRAVDEFQQAPQSQPAVVPVSQPVNLAVVTGRWFRNVCPDCKEFNGMGMIDDRHLLEHYESDPYDPCNRPCLWCGKGPMIRQYLDGPDDCIHQPETND